MDAAKQITLVIPCWNRQADLDLLLGSLGRLKSLPRVIIVDDYSNPPIRGGAAEVVRLREKLGTSAAKNTGLALCKTKYIWFLDSDTEILNPGMLETAVGHLQADERLAGAGGEIYSGVDGKRYLCENIILPDYSTFRWLSVLKRRVIKDAGFVSTCNIIMRADALRKVGGFCSALKIHEDKLACLLLRQMGYRVLIDSDLAVAHHLSQSGRTSEEAFWNEYAGDSAFVFGALSGVLKIKMFPVYTLISRALEIAGIPKLVYDYVRINNGRSNSKAGA